MSVRFNQFYRGFLILLGLILMWSVWSLAAQSSTNAAGGITAGRSAAPAGPTNNGSASVPAPKDDAPQTLTPPQWIEKLAVDLPFLKWTLWENELWKYGFSLVYVFLAFYISKFLDYLIRVWLKKWAEKTTTKFDDLLLDLLHGPIKVVAFIIFLRIGLAAFHWPEMVQKFLAKGFTIIVAASLTYMVLKFIDLLMGYWRQRVASQDDQTFNHQLFPIVRKSLKAFIVIVAVLVTLDNIGINITAAIASLSIGGLAVGLAAQDTLANLFGAVAIFLDKPFKIGDRIQVDNVDGPVESIGLRSTRVRNLDGHLITIPNKTMGNATITNIAARPSIRTEMNLGLTYDTPVEKVQRATAILNEIFRSHPKTSDLIVSFNKFTDSALNILVVHVWSGTDAKEHFAALQELNLQIKQRFDAEGIEFAFPTQTVHLKRDA